MTTPGLIDVEELFADPEFSGASISPDGARLAYLAPWSGRTNVWVRGLDEEHADAVCVTHDDRRGIRRYRVMHVEPFRAVPGSVLVSMNRRPLDVDVFRIDVASGETVVHRENPDRRGGFVFGRSGEVVVQSQADDGTFEYHAVDDATGGRRLFHRQGGPEHPLGVHPARITSDGAGLLVGSYQDSDDLRLVRVDIATGEQSVVAGLPGQSRCVAEAVSPAAAPTLFVSRRTGEVLAARFVGDRPVIQVVDPGFAEVYAALSRLSDGVLAGLSSDDSERLWVATFAHDREPGLTYLYDHGTGESRLLFRPHPRLDPGALAPMTPVAFAARDGLPLHGFLTLPVGVEPTSLPLVLFLHGGPWFHDVWGYNPTAQFLANRGYAVAVDYCGISSLPNFMRTLPEFLRPQMVNNFLLYCGDPAGPEQEADLLARSPITMVDRIRTPLLVVQGANDVRVVKAESDAIVEALRARGVAVGYLVADDEGHGFQNPENVMAMFRTVERHFAEHLGGLGEEQR